ncbi:hypothetical protein FZEAL_6170 [Fusarium zealandicum]|uniref:FAD/NAD(P)-binding domain-containing protein n=1 Tax=Fusarium zealandicum TaxID=1053134 RepID=A0A8H4XJR4_9HYPO|nr:hypothetical protein FZEAL_6170 [Fusarium zealandicum]
MKIRYLLFPFALVAAVVPYNYPIFEYNVLVIGGGPAGLAAADDLAQQNFKVCLFDSGKHRVDAARTIRRFPLVFDKPRPPRVLRKIMHEALLNEPKVNLVEGKIIKIERTKPGPDGMFKVEIAASKKTTYLGKTVILAPGWEDEFPDIAGYEDAWSKVIFNDALSYGELDAGGRSSGILAVGDTAKVDVAMHLARLALGYTEKVVIFTNDNSNLADKLNKHIKDSASKALKKRIRVEDLRIERFAYRGEGPDKDMVVMFDKGGFSNQEFMIHWPKGRVNLDFIGELNLALTSGGLIKVDPGTMKTSEEGVYAIGDCVSHRKTIIRGFYTAQLAVEAIVVSEGAKI